MKEVNLYYTMDKNYFKLDLRELSLLERIRMGFAIARRNIIVIKGKQRLKYSL